MGKKLSREDQNKIIELASQGKQPKEIAKETNHTETTVNKVLSSQFITALANLNTGGGGGVGTGLVPTSGDENAIIIRPMGDTAELSKALVFSPQHAFQAGQTLGFNLTTFGLEANRLLHRRGSNQEGLAFLGNLLGIVVGGHQGIRSYDEILPEEKEAIKRAAQMPNIEEIIRAALAQQSEQTAEIVALTITKLKDKGVFK